MKPPVEVPSRWLGFDPGVTEGDRAVITELTMPTEETPGRLAYHAVLVMQVKQVVITTKLSRDAS